MAKRRPPESPHPPPALQVPREEAATRISKRIDLGKEFLQRAVGNPDEYQVLSNEHNKWNAFNRELLRQLFTTEELSEEYAQYYGFLIGGPRSLAEKIEDLRRDIGDGVQRLDSIRERLELIPEAAGIGATVGIELTPAIGVGGGDNSPPSRGEPKPSGSTKVFLVHGHDGGHRETVARYLEKLGLDPIILHEQPNASRTIIEKLERYAGQASFAVVLLTPDDMGYPANSPDSQKPRARQNVILELGYFLGKLGRHQVCALHTGEVELPSDYDGVLYVPIDQGEGWKLWLARELREAGFPIDMNRTM